MTLLVSLKTFFRKVVGYYAYKRLKGEWAVILNDGIGEFVFTSAYIPSCMAKRGVKDFILVTKRRFSSLARLYPFYKNVKILNDRELNCLCSYLSGKDPDQTKCFNSLWKDKKTFAILTKYEKAIPEDQHGELLSLIISEYFSVDNRLKYFKPSIHPLSGNEKSYYDRIAKNSIMLNPLATTCKMLDKVFWLELAAKLEEKGYKVLFNCPETYDHGHFDFFQPPLDTLPSIVKEMKGAISIQCGLSDLLVECGCNTIVLFVHREGDTNYRRFTNNGTPFEVPNGIVLDETLPMNQQIPLVIEALENTNNL